jgi:hypothetical protein
MVYPLDGQGRRVEFGAGIIVSQTPDRTVIITADHVVQAAANDEAVEVEFASQVGRPFRAQVFSRRAPRPGLDLAVLFVYPRPGTAVIPSIVTEGTRGALRIEDPSAFLKERVLIVGNMNDRPWSQNFIPDPIVESDANRLVIESDHVSPGASGGAVFDTNGQILGMVVTAERSGAVARPIRALLDQVRAWHIEIGLRYEDRAATVMALGALRDMGFEFQPQSFAEALVAGNIKALELFERSGATTSMTADAMRIRRQGSDICAAQQFFAAARDLPLAEQEAGEAWFSRALAGGLDPDLTLPGEYYAAEALVHLAVRVRNYRMLRILLEAGASPHGFQEIDLTPFPTARFLFPIDYVLNEELLDPGDRRMWVERLIKAGAVVPRLVRKPGENSWASGMYEARQMQNTARERLGEELPESPDLCSGRANTAVCAAASKRYGFDWCRFVDELPKTVLPVEGRGYSLIWKVRLSYLIRATSDAAFFIAINDPGISSPGYVLVRVPRNAQSLTVWRFVDDRLLRGRTCRLGSDGGPSYRCWASETYSLDIRTDLLRSRLGETFKLTSECGPFPTYSDK